MWSADQLISRCTLICEGTVTSIKQDGAVREFDYGGMKCREIVMLAKIQVSRVIKGKADTEIEFRYRAVEPATVSNVQNGFSTSINHFVVDGPEHIKLGQGRKFQFFLNSAPNHHGYISVMEGSPDDNQSVVPVT